MVHILLLSSYSINCLSSLCFANTVVSILTLKLVPFQNIPEPNRQTNKPPNLSGLFLCSGLESPLVFASLFQRYPSFESNFNSYLLDSWDPHWRLSWWPRALLSAPDWSACSYVLHAVLSCLSSFFKLFHNHHQMLIALSEVLGLFINLESPWFLSLSPTTSPSCGQSDAPKMCAVPRPHTPPFLHFLSELPKQSSHWFSHFHSCPHTIYFPWNRVSVKGGNQSTD